MPFDAISEKQRVHRNALERQREQKVRSTVEALKERLPSYGFNRGRMSEQTALSEAIEHIKYMHARLLKDPTTSKEMRDIRRKVLSSIERVKPDLKPSTIIDGIFPGLSTSPKNRRGLPTKITYKSKTQDGHEIDEEIAEEKVVTADPQEEINFTPPEVASTSSFPFPLPWNDLYFPVSVYNQPSFHAPTMPIKANNSGSYLIAQDSNNFTPVPTTDFVDSILKNGRILPSQDVKPTFLRDNDPSSISLTNENALEFPNEQERVLSPLWEGVDVEEILMNAGYDDNETKTIFQL